jgi:AcrR family transcriptional regulator
VAITKRPNPLDPRKKPTQKRAGKTVEAIVEAAAHILERHGLAGYTTNAIAERAGVSIGSLYQYFGGKDGITIALVERETAELLREINEAENIQDWHAGMEAMIRAAVRQQLRRPQLARLLDFEEARLPPSAHSRAMADTVLKAIERRLSAMPGRQEDDMKVMAFDVVALTKGLIDAAGARGESDFSSLEVRARKAVFGYLAA